MQDELLSEHDLHLQFELHLVQRNQACGEIYQLKILLNVDQIF